jgi:hypothetical protein
MLSKFFLMPVKDEADPDYKAGEEEEEEKKEGKSPPFSSPNMDQSLTEIAKKTNPSTISMQQVDNLTNLLRQKGKGSREVQTQFFTELDQQLTKGGVEGTTQVGNFRSRLSSLTPADYQYLYN